MNTTQRTGMMQRWHVLQYDLLPELKNEVGVLTPKLEQVIDTLKWVRIDEFVVSSWCGNGRPPHDRAALASAFVAKAVLGLSITKGLIERLTIDRALRRICGFAMWKRLPDEAIFSRAFAEFAADGLAERAHAALVKETSGERLIGHISRDGTAIESREKPVKKVEVKEVPAEATVPALDMTPVPIEQQCGLPLAHLLKTLPCQCDTGTRSNAQGYRNNWNGYKLHIDTADCGIPVSALLTSASMHDSLAAIPLSLMTAERG